MKKAFMFLASALGVAGLTAVADAQPPGGAAPAPAARPTVAVFNMAGVMRDFGQAKYQVHLLNKRKDAESKNLMAWRGQYIEIQKELTKNPNNPQKDKMVQDMLNLSRAIEDEDRRINKILNDEASKIIADLYDKIKAVVDKTAEINGYQIVFAYPDAVTTEEMNSPYIKELKLKPPAAQPFFVSQNADITGVVVKTLNSWYKPVGPDGKEIDVSKLDIPTPQPGNTGLPGTAAPQPKP